MRTFIALEFRFLLWSVCAGMLLGTAYNILTVLRRLFVHNRFAVGVEDTVYWIAAALVMSVVILVANDGAVRWFAVGGMTAGMAISAILLKYLEKGLTIIYRRYAAMRRGHVKNTKRHIRKGK